MEKFSFRYRCIRKIGAILGRMHKRMKLKRVALKYTERAAKRVKLIGGGYKGSAKEYKETVIRYWSRYGVKPRRIWYALYCNGKDAYDPRFIPDSMWFCKILPYFNNMERQEAYADKGMFNRLLPDVKQPETIVKNLAGYYYNGDKEELITREEAERLCECEEHLIIKPYRGSKGKGILFYDRDDKNTTSIRSAFDKIGSGFVVQRLVKQHPDLAKLNEDSLNTIRVISFHFNGEVHILSSQLRIGGTGARVDNVSAGGCACSIKPDGWLQEKSVTRKSVWTDETANGIKFKDIRVPSYEGVVETAKRLHCQLPYFNIIGWDFSVGEDGSPILIEFNVRPGQNQIGDGTPTFGDLSDEVLEDVFIKKTLKNAF